MTFIKEETVETFSLKKKVLYRKVSKSIDESQRNFYLDKIVSLNKN